MSLTICQLATPNIDSFAQYSIASVRQYAQGHGYRHVVQRSPLVAGMHINWTKIALLDKILKASSDDYVMLLDADIIIVNPGLKLDYFIEMAGAGKDILMPADTPVLKPRRPNAGMVIVKNSAGGREIVANWLKAAKNEGKHLADIHPRNQLVYWNFVMPKYLHRQFLIPRSFAAKYHWFLPVFGRSRFLLHVTQTFASGRNTIMQRLFNRYTESPELLRETAKILREKQDGELVMVD